MDQVLVTITITGMADFQSTLESEVYRVAEGRGIAAA
jgi:hypothetical protein